MGPLDSQDITPKMFQSSNFKRVPHDKCIQVHVSENSESSFLESKLLTFRVRRLCQALVVFINLWRECPVAPQSRWMLLKSIMALFTSCGCQQLHPEFPPSCYCNPDHQLKKNWKGWPSVEHPPSSQVPKLFFPSKKADDQKSAADLVAWNIVMFVNSRFFR